MFCFFINPIITNIISYHHRMNIETVDSMTRCIIIHSLFHPFNHLSYSHCSVADDVSAAAAAAELDCDGTVDRCSSDAAAAAADDGDDEDSLPADSQDNSADDAADDNSVVAAAAAADGLLPEDPTCSVGVHRFHPRGDSKSPPE